MKVGAYDMNRIPPFAAHKGKESDLPTAGPLMVPAVRKFTFFEQRKDREMSHTAAEPLRLPSEPKKWITQKRATTILRLTFLLMLLAITAMAVFMPASPLHAAALLPQNHSQSSSKQNSLDPCAYQLVCNAASQYASGTTGAPAGGWIQTPIGANGNTMVFFTNPILTVSQPTVQGLWNLGVLIVDAFIVFLFIVSGIRVMMSGSVFRYADIAETVPRMLLALIAAHISLALMGILLGLNNGMCAVLYSYATSHVTPAANLDTTLGNDPQVSLWNFLDSIWVPLVKLIIYIIRLALGLTLFAQLIVRVFLIDVYIVLSAPCIACWALPGRSGQPVTRMWLQGFISLVMVQTAQTVGIIVAELILSNIIALVNQLNVLPLTNGGPMTANEFVTSFMSIVVTWFVLKIPGMLQASPMQSIAAGGRMASGMFEMAAGGAARLAETRALLSR